MMFIYDYTYQRLINLDHVRSAEPAPPEDKNACSRYALHGADGERIAFVSQRSLHDVATPVIPAASGFFSLRFYWDYSDRGDSEEFAIKMPIVAWRITSHGNATPVDFETELAANGTDVCILFPDGRVLDADHTAYENYDAWFSASKEYARKAYKDRKE